MSATGAEGIRLKESTFINNSLLVLGNVISKLSDGPRHFSWHMQPSLGGNAKIFVQSHPQRLPRPNQLSTYVWKMIGLATVDKVQTRLHEMLKRYSEVFQDDLGTMKECVETTK